MMHALPFRSTGTVTSGILDLVHGDLVSMPVASASGYHYFVAFHDNASGFHAAYLLRKKSDTFAAFTNFHAWAEQQTGRKLRAFHDDKGGEFIGNEWSALFSRLGVQRRHTTRNHPQQNGVAERANRTIVEAIAAALAESGLPHSFWAECLASFIHVWNRLPSSSTAARATATTPYELWFGRKPDLAHLRVWGCRAYAHVQRDKRSKLDWHMVPCIFIGYPDDFRGWKFWDPASKRSFVSERSEFDERYFPLSKLNAGVPRLVPLSPSSPITEDDGPTFPSLDAQPSNRDAPELPLQPVKQVRFLVNYPGQPPGHGGQPRPDPTKSVTRHG